MLFRTPADTYRAYERFLKKRNFRKAYKCLESLLHQFPGDEALLADIVNLAYFDWGSYEMARPWLLQLTKVRSLWQDYALLSRGEARAGNVEQARDYLAKAKKVFEKRATLSDKKEAKAMFSDIESLIGYHESRPLLIPERENIAPLVGKNVSISGADDTRDHSQKVVSLKENGSKEDLAKPEPKPEATREPKAFTPAEYHVPVSFSPLGDEVLKPFQQGSLSTLREIKLLIDYTHLNIQSSFDELLCLNAIQGVERYWYQIETVKKVLKYFRGRAILSDEVGLGKTIEAGMIIKEYLMRDMVRNVLILTPSSLVSQWKEEMESKFRIEFRTTEDGGSLGDPEAFWKSKFIIASLNLAKGKKNIPLVTQRFYDLVVVDEAHHLRNRSTLAWKLINQIQKRLDRKSVV